MNRPPYLHDGKAQTLEEIWTKFSEFDEHGVANDMDQRPAERPGGIPEVDPRCEVL
jgi:hypothetical protein